MDPGKQSVYTLTIFKEIISKNKQFCTPGLPILYKVFGCMSAESAPINAIPCAMCGWIQNPEINIARTTTDKSTQQIIHPSNRTGQQQ